MRCLGRTKNFSRCKNTTKGILCRHHKLQWWGMIIIIATLGGLFQDILKPGISIFAKKDEGLILQYVQVKPDSLNPELDTKKSEIISENSQEPKIKSDTTYDENIVSKYVSGSPEGNIEKEGKIKNTRDAIKPNIVLAKRQISDDDDFEIVGFNEIDRESLFREKVKIKLKNELYKYDINYMTFKVVCLLSYLGDEDKEKYLNEEDSNSRTIRALDLEFLEKPKNQNFSFNNQNFLISNNSNTSTLIVENIKINWRYFPCEKIVMDLFPVNIIQNKFNEINHQIIPINLKASLTKTSNSFLLSKDRYKYKFGDVDEFVIKLEKPKGFGKYEYWYTFDYYEIGKNKKEYITDKFKFELCSCILN